MNEYRLKALMGLLDYLSGSMGKDLIEPEMKEHMPEEAKQALEGLEGAMPGKKEPMSEEEKEMGLDEDEDAKGLSISKVSVIGDKPGKDNEPSEDELEELLKRFKKG